MTKKSLSNDVFDAAFNRMAPAYNPEKDSVLDFIDLSVETGILKEKLDSSKLFDLNILNKVLKEMNYKSID